MNSTKILVLSFLCTTSFLSHGMETKPTQEAVEQANHKLWHAVEMNDIAEVKQLITEGIADLNAGEFPPLIFASWSGRIECAIALIKAGADINIVNYNGGTALICACVSNKLPVAKALIAAGADVNIADKCDNTAFAWAVKNKNAELVDVFVNAKANVDNALLLAANIYSPWNKEETSHCLDVLNTLIKAGGANVNIQDADQCTPLILAAGKNDNAPIVKALIEAGANVNMVDKNGKTALLVALQNLNRELIEALVKAGANVNVYDEHGAAALVYVIEFGLSIEPEISMPLINPTAKPAIRKKIETLLMIYNEGCPCLSELPKEILKIIITYTCPEYVIDYQTITNLHPQALVDNVPLETLAVLIKDGTLNRDTILGAWKERLKNITHVLQSSKKLSNGADIQFFETENLNTIDTLLQ